MGHGVRGPSLPLILVGRGRRVLNSGGCRLLPGQAGARSRGPPEARGSRRSTRGPHRTRIWILGWLRGSRGGLAQRGTLPPERPFLGRGVPGPGRSVLALNYLGRSPLRPLGRPSNHAVPGPDLRGPNGLPGAARLRVRLVHGLHAGGPEARGGSRLSPDPPEGAADRCVRGPQRDSRRLDVEPSDRHPPSSGPVARHRGRQLPDVGARLRPPGASGRAHGVHDAGSTPGDPPRPQEPSEVGPREGAPRDVGEPGSRPGARLPGEPTPGATLYWSGRASSGDVRRPGECEDGPPR